MKELSLFGYVYHSTVINIFDIVASFFQQALTLVFVETKKGADSLEHWLSMHGFPATTIHGDRTQQVSESSLIKLLLQIY